MIPIRFPHLAVTRHRNRALHNTKCKFRATRGNSSESMPYFRVNQQIVKGV
jgi:hypothetical protein